MLAWTVREGVTNVIRHSCARWCHIQVMGADGNVAAQVINDGVREPEPSDAPAPTGSGLVGLAERVAAHGGQIEYGALHVDDNACFRLWVQLPIGGVNLRQEPRP